MFRVGLGQDSHRFSQDKNRKLILGGVEVLKEKGLEGNSDADVIIHSICHALEQAIGGESFSVYADKMSEEGINDSRKYLEIAVSHVKKAGYAIGNVGISLECKIPKISIISEEIKKMLAEILRINISQIGISATSGEGLTEFGKGKGIQSFTIVGLIKNEKN